MSEGKNKEMEIIARQLSQLLRDAKRDLINELTRDQREFYDSNNRRDFRLLIISLHQKWRDRCISSSESAAENYLDNCITLDIESSNCIPTLEKILYSFIDDTYNSLKLSCSSISIITPEPCDQYFSEAEGMMRPYLERRISEIIENAKDGFCRGTSIAKRVFPFINAGEVTMGDKYENIHGSTIVNRSLIETSFNKVKRDFDQETADALKKVADEIERSNNQDAAENFTSFNEELQKPEPKRAVLRALWSGITSALPTITQATDVATKIEKLLS